MKSVRRLSLAPLALVALIAASSAPALASGEQVLVDKARIAVEELRGDARFGSFPKYLARAKAVLLVPELVKAGFIFGGEGGSGVLVVRDPQSGAWSDPAFYTMASASVGLQIGVQVSNAVFLVMTDGGLEKLMSDKLTLGADASVAAGPVGLGVEAGTTLNIEADIYAFARSKGLFGGVSFEGAVLVPDRDANTAYYGRAVSSRGIVLRHEVANPGADGLRAALGAQ